MAEIQLFIWNPFWAVNEITRFFSPEIWEK